MTVIPFERKPASVVRVRNAVARMAVEMAEWAFDVAAADDNDDTAFVQATHVRHCTTLTAHWGGDHWGVVDTDYSVLARSQTLEEAFGRAFALAS